MKKLFSILTCLCLIFAVGCVDDDTNNTSSQDEGMLGSMPDMGLSDIIEGDTEDGKIDGEEDAENGGNVDSSKNRNGNGFFGDNGNNGGIGEIPDNIPDGSTGGNGGNGGGTGSNGGGIGGGNNTAVTDGGIMDGGAPGSPDYLP